MYSTLMGSLSLLIPFPSVEDMELFTTLEMHMRQELPCMSGRDHMAFRGSYFPVKAVVDGDLIELYNSLPWERRQTIAEELERNPNEVSRQIELIKARVS
jgi:splicing factor 3B subunit 3